MSLPAAPTPVAVPAASRARYLLDSNILLRRVELAHPHHAAALAAVRALSSSGAELCVAPQGIYEFWAVATRPVKERGLGNTPAQAQHDATFIESIFTLLHDGPDIYREWRRIVAAYSVSGKTTHDARMVAAMKVHGLSHLLTFNVAHFRRFEAAPPQGEGITVIEPAGVLPLAETL